jgi:hypothetical protein
LLQDLKGSGRRRPDLNEIPVRALIRVPGAGEVGMATSDPVESRCDGKDLATVIDTTDIIRS